MVAVRKGPWKYYFKVFKDRFTRHQQILAPDEPLLYNVENDIAETINKANQHPEIMNEYE
ncbi:MAG: hypothetical protein LIP06_07115 [Tannerellaceae bacterium]|nr:hypothetical protein [Tannerellaceae bacterium]